jgi:hypothetical protein
MAWTSTRRTHREILIYAQVVRGTDRGDGVFGGAFAFAVIAEDGSRLCLQAENEDERLRWVSALRRATGAPMNDDASIGDFGVVVL